MVQASILADKTRHHFGDGRVDEFQDDLWINPQDEDEGNDWNDNHSLLQIQIGEDIPLRLQWSAKNPLQNGKQEDGGHEQANDREGTGPSRQRERAFEDEKLADETV